MPVEHRNRAHMAAHHHRMDAVMPSRKSEPRTAVYCHSACSNCNFCLLDMAPRPNGESAVGWSRACPRARNAFRPSTLHGLPGGYLRVWRPRLRSDWRRAPINEVPLVATSLSR